MTDTSTDKTTQTIQVQANKNVAIAVILTFFFGPLGMLYSTVTGGIIMLIVSFLVGIFTLGLGLLITWPICIIWGAIAAKNGAPTNFTLQSSTTTSTAKVDEQA